MREHSLEEIVIVRLILAKINFVPVSQVHLKWFILLFPSSLVTLLLILNQGLCYFLHLRSLWSIKGRKLLLIGLKLLLLIGLFLRLLLSQPLLLLLYKLLIVVLVLLSLIFLRVIKGWKF